MAIDLTPHGGNVRIRISEELNIYTAAALRDAVLALPPADGPRRFDLGEVSEIDTAGLQVLLAALRPPREGAPVGVLDACSQAVRDCLELCGLAALLPAVPLTRCGEQ